MKTIHTYLNFDGNAREAMTFYQKCLGADLRIQTFKDAKRDAPRGAEDRVMHAHLQKGSSILMGSDVMPGMPFRQGSNFSVMVECENAAEIERLFKAFSESGKVTMPLADQFWGARFGMITDRFGVSWMFNCELPRKA